MNNLMAETEFINYLKLLQDNKNDYIIIIAVKTLWVHMLGSMDVSCCLRWD